MNYWYFKFEGIFEKESKRHGQGLFSACMIPEKNFQKAKKLFLIALKNEKIKLVRLMEHFTINGFELDPKDKANSFWVNFYKKAKKSNNAVFDIWHIYKLGT